jgi:SAM-dependent methyltransferase
MSTSAVGLVHDKLVISRRAGVLSDWFAKLVPRSARVLDVGSGDGLIASLLQSKRPDIEIRGVDVLVRPGTHIPVEMFDGTNLPFGDDSFDVVLFSDVLHHTNDPVAPQREARRVARQRVLIKDHFRKGLAAGARLRFMDWVGNSRFGVKLPYNYWTETQWHTAWKTVGLRPEQMIDRLGLYPVPADWFFGAQLHFIALLEKCDPIQA